MMLYRVVHPRILLLLRREALYPLSYEDMSIWLFGLQQPKGGEGGI